MEHWKELIGLRVKTEVSNYGRIKRNEILLSPAINKDGYFQCCFKQEVKKNHLLHRLIAGAFLSNPENLPVINHKDTNKLNNRVDNLEWCTQTHNIKHATINGLMAVNERNGNCRIPDNVVSGIKTALTTGMSTRRIASVFNVSRSAVNHIKQGRTRKTVK